MVPADETGRRIVRATLVSHHAGVADQAAPVIAQRLAPVRAEARQEVPHVLDVPSLMIDHRSPGSDARRGGRPRLLLAAARDAPLDDRVQRAREQRGSTLGALLPQLGHRQPARQRKRFLREDLSRIRTVVHAMHRHPRLTVVRVVDPEMRRRTAMSGQQGRMEIDGAEWRNRVHLVGQQPGIPGHAEQVGSEGREPRAERRVVGLRLPVRDALPPGEVDQGIARPDREATGHAPQPVPGANPRGPSRGPAAPDHRHDAVAFRYRTQGRERGFTSPKEHDGQHRRDNAQAAASVQVDSANHISGF